MQLVLGFVFSCLPRTMQQNQDLKFNYFKNIINTKTRIDVVSVLTFSFLVWDETDSNWYVDHYLSYCISPG
jgi:hypothetical protein